MKTLKTIAILIIYLFTFTGTQTAHAQTKEATIKWIKEKLAQYGKDEDTKTKHIMVTPCRISWEETWYKKNIPKGSDTYSFDPSAAGMWTYKTDENGWLILVSEARIIERELSSGKKYHYSEFYIRNGEKGLGASMAKALNHLAGFCK